VLGDIVDWLVGVVHGVVHWFDTIAPGGLGLMLVPLIVLGGITIWVARKQ